MEKISPYGFLKKAFVIKTKRNTEIQVYWSAPLSEEKQKFLDDYYEAKFGRARRHSNSSYNCHGLSLIGKLGCIFPEKTLESSLMLPPSHLISEQDEEKQIEILLRENGYAMLIRLGDVNKYILKGNEGICVGDLAVYKSIIGEGRETISHTGIVIGLLMMNDRLCDVNILSKMGIPGGEYIHSYKITVEGMGNLLEIWSDRDSG
jgi:hypothetical protein